MLSAPARTIAGTPLTGVYQRHPKQGRGEYLRKWPVPSVPFVAVAVACARAAKRAEPVAKESQKGKRGKATAAKVKVKPATPQAEEALEAKQSAEKKSKVLKQLLGMGLAAPSPEPPELPVPTVPATVQMPPLPTVPTVPKESKASTVEAIAAATEAALLAGELLRKGEEWQSAAQREVRHHFEDADAWTWDLGKASSDKDAVVSLFAEHQGESIAVLFDPWRDELFTAVSGTDLKEALVGTESSQDLESSWSQLRGLYYLGPPRSRGVRILENPEIGHAWVAAGRLGAFFSLTTSNAGSLLVHEAGGLEDQGVSALSSDLRDQVVEALREAKVWK
ncbi:unnamed protein product [Durusdinium trenchii]|uniref:Uncharacterized protein n=1 Tax=Durusdinium trenchii TaxID=1381693 RepID=A0ABP0JBF3_9DINO